MSPPPSHGAGGRALPLRSLLTRSRAGVFIAKPSRSRALRRVVAEPFQERISAGSPPEVSRGSFFLPPQPIPGPFRQHRGSQSCLSGRCREPRMARPWAGWTDAGSRKRQPAHRLSKCKWPRIGSGCERSQLALGRFSKFIQCENRFHLTLI